MLMQQQSWILSKKPVFTILYSVICLSYFFTVAIIALFYLLIIRSYNFILVMLYNFNYIFSSLTSNLNGTVQPYCADVPLRNYSLTHSLTHWRVIVSQFLIAVDMMSFAHTDSCVDSATIFKSSTLSWWQCATMADLEILRRGGDRKSYHIIIRQKYRKFRIGFVFAIFSLNR